MQDMNQARITITGTAMLVPNSETEAVKQFYLSKNPNSFWVEFGDFSWWRMEDLVAVRYNSGFARAGQVRGLTVLGSGLMFMLSFFQGIGRCIA